MLSRLNKKSSRGVDEGKVERSSKTQMTSEQQVLCLKNAEFQAVSEETVSPANNALTNSTRLLIYHASGKEGEVLIASIQTVLKRRPQVTQSSENKKSCRGVDEQRKDERPKRSRSKCLKNVMLQSFWEARQRVRVTCVHRRALSNTNW